MNSVEMTAKTVKEAIRLGLEQLHCESSDDVDIEVLEFAKPGIFGIFGKPAKVRLTRKADTHDFDFDMPKLSLDGGSAKSGKPKAEKPKAEKTAPRKKEEASVEPAAEETPDKADAPKPEHKKNKPKSRKEQPKQPEQEASEPAEAPAPVIVEEEPFVPTEEDKLTESALKARSFLQELTEKMGAPVTMELQESPEQLRIKMSGENMSMYIGRHGETLDSVQYLTSLCVNRGREDYLRVSLDTENYRAKREETLRKLAMRMANRARKTGKRVALEPMNPYERRILHSALQNDPYVTTHSEGEEPYRRVIITLK